MESFKRIRLRSYVIHLSEGTFSLVFGISVLYSILLEMVTAYTAQSRYAYIFGIAACAILLAYGFYSIHEALNFDRKVVGSLGKDERKSFFGELSDTQTLFFDRYLFVTRKHVLVCTSSWNPKARILKMDDLIACFGVPYYAGSNELVQYDVVLCTSNFEIIRCEVKGRKAGMMADAVKAIVSMAPWVLSKYYEEFMTDIGHKSQRRSIKKIVEHRKEEREVNEEELAEVVISAADVIRSFQEKNEKKDREHPQTLKNIKNMKNNNNNGND